MIDVRLAQPLPRAQTLRPLPRLRLRLPRAAVLVAWTCLPLFAAQLLLLSVLLTQ